MRSSERGESNIGFVGWILILLIVAGFLGVGPCADSCYIGGPKLQVEVKK